MFAEDEAPSDFIRATVTEEGTCAPEIFYIYIYFYILYYILPENRDLIGFYCRALTV